MNKLRNEHILHDTRERLLSEGGKILVYQTAFLGDVILITPLLRVLHNTFPGVQLKAVTIPESASLLAEMVDEVILIDKRDKENAATNWQKLENRLAREKFDISFTPHRSLRSALTVKKAEIPCRIGFDRGPGSLINNLLRPYEFGVYEGIRNLNLLHGLIDIEDNGLPELHPSNGDEKVAQEIIASLHLGSGQFAIIAPGSVWKTKRWSAKSFGKLTARLEEERGIPSVAIGSKDDFTVCVESVTDKRYNLAGQLTMMEFAALTSRACILVGGDSAPSHVATAMKTKQVMIYGSTAARFGFMPPIPTASSVGLDLWCRPCTGHGRNVCPRMGSMKCMERISVEMVFNEMNALLQSEDVVMETQL